MNIENERLELSFQSRGKLPLLFLLFTLVSACTPVTNSSMSSSSLASSASSASSSAPSVTMSSYSNLITGSTSFTLGSAGDYLSSETSETQLDVYSIEMHGQYGDATLIDYGNYEILVDGGASADGPYVQAMLANYVTDHVLDMLVVTHPHSDHYGGLTSSATWSDITSITSIVDYGYFGGNNYETQRDSYISRGSEYHPITELIMHSDGIYHISEKLSLQFLNTNMYLAPGGSTNDANPISICSLLTFGNTVFYLSGDSTGDTETGIRHNYPGLITADQVVVAKSAHHGSGSNESNNKYFIELFLKPDYVFISAAIDIDNRTSSGLVKDQHPYVEPIARYAVSTDQIYWNGINGTIRMHSDGTAVTFTGAGRTLDYYVGGVAVDRNVEKDFTIFQSQWYLNYLI